MKKVSILNIIATISFAGLLSACNLDNNELNEPEGVDYRPVRFDMDNNLNNDQNDINNRGTDLDVDPRDVRNRQEIDTPFNMDEEEPDLDEEPSEERRGW